MEGWIFSKKKATKRYGHSYPPCAQARKTFTGKTGSSDTRWEPTDYSQVLLCYYADGSSTVSMNAVAHMTPDDIRDMAKVMESLKESML